MTTTDTTDTTDSDYVTTERFGTIRVQNAVTIDTYQFVDFHYGGDVGPELACIVGDGGTLIVHALDGSVHFHAAHAWFSAEVTYGSAEVAE